MALYVVIGSFFGFGVGGSMLPQPKSTEANKPSAVAADVDNPTKAIPAVQPAKPSTAKSDIMSLWSKVKSASAGCDKANGNVADALGSLGKSTSIYAAYELADNAHAVCRESWSVLNDLEVPDSIEGDDAEQLEKTLENCASAYLLRQMSLDKMKTVLNGDMRPSALQDYKGDAQAAQGGVMACVAGMMSAGMKAGVDVKEFK